MQKYQTISLITGWVVFAIAFITYMLTIEPTASLWDCSEFIATSYKLEVGHPPGTPFFFLINRLGAMFAGSPENVAYAINALSALESALTILFLFWSIVMLGRMIYRRTNPSLTESQNWSVIAASAIGALAYAFSDSFWFSAVEAEVYALSSLFTAIVFWAILKWETIADEPHSNRWLILIAYLMGISIGAHILNLLTIPALVFVYYFKKFPNQKKINLWKPGLIAILLTGAFYSLTPTLLGMGAGIDRLFVNSFSLPVNLGLTTFIVIILAALAVGIWWSHKNVKVTWNMIFLSASLVIIGCSSYGVVLIRSAANPPMDSNNPDNPYSLISFINREQYGSRPLVKGQSFASTVVGNKKSSTYRINENGKYEKVSRLIDYEYDPATEIIFPRMHSQSENGSHQREYKTWSGAAEKEAAGKPWGKQVRDANGEIVTIPTFGENLKFFFGYQMNHMYWRYFLWNFVGRQSDIQSTGNIDNGQWMSGITPLDELYLGPQDKLPGEMAANRGRNFYFFLPLILGLIGLFYQLRQDGRGFLIVFMLFFMTGIAIILYLNQTPLQPRERDYAYVGSFYAFAIWIGLGVMQVFDALHKRIKNGKIAVAIATVICASVPVIMATQNWDDHDRSGRTIARDMGHNYLNSTLPNSILINYGDNDTFPVWYAQEVESVRPDVRPMNFSYITGDWYIDQMKIKVNNSEPVPFSLPRHKYREGAVRSFPIQEIPHPNGGEWTVQEVMAIVNSDEKSTKVFAADGTAYDFIPTSRIAVPVNKPNAIKSGILRAQDAHLASDTIYINIKGKKYLSIDEVLFLDLLANFDWKRPLYFTNYGDMMKFDILHLTNDSTAYSYLQNDGAAYRLTPIKTPVPDIYSVGRVDSELLYDNLMNKFGYGNIADPHVYVDAFVENTFSLNHIRATFAQLANALTEQGDTVRAVQVLDRAMEVMPLSKLRYDDNILALATAYWKAGAIEKGNALAEGYAKNEVEYVDYFAQFTGSKAQLVGGLTIDHLRNVYLICLTAQENGQDHLFQKYMPYLQAFIETTN